MANPFGEDYGTVSGRGRGFRSRGSDVASIQRDVSNAVQEVQRQTSNLRSLSLQIGTEADTAELRRRIYQLRRSTQQKLESVRSGLSDLVQAVQSSADTRLRLAVQSLQQTVQKEGNNFVAVTEALLEKLQAYPSPPDPAPPTHGYLDSEEVEVTSERVKLLRPSQEEEPLQRTQQQHFLVSSELAHVEERAEKMQEIEADIRTLHEMMGDIGHMVVLQGENIQTIEQAVDTAASNVTSANQQLGKAVRYKKCSRKLICCIAIVLSVILAIIIIIVIVLATTLGKKNN